jgi:hypothetical protein
MSFALHRFGFALLVEAGGRLLRNRYEFRHKGLRFWRESQISRAALEDLLPMGWKLLIAFVLVLVVGAGALAFYGASVGPAKHPIEQVIPDTRFPK